MAAKVHMVHYNPVTSKVVKRVELPTFTTPSVKLGTRWSFSGPLGVNGQTMTPSTLTPSKLTTRWSLSASPIEDLCLEIGVGVGI
jgi:hypothetical protein